MGGIDTIDNDKEMASTGGKPLSDYSSLEDKTNQPSKPLQYRAQGSAGVKSYTFRTEGPKHKFDKSGNLEVFCTNGTRFLLNPIKADFKRNIKQIVEFIDTFAVIWITVMRKMYQNTVEFFLNLEEMLKLWIH